MISVTDAKPLVPDTRFARLAIKGVGGGLVAGVCAWMAYIGLLQAHRVWLLAQNPQVAFAGVASNPVVIAGAWVLLVVSAVLLVILGIAGGYLVVTHKLWSRLGSSSVRPPRRGPGRGEKRG